MNLYIRISHTDICFACYEATNAQQFQFQTFHLRPQVSLMVNLREAVQQIEMLRQSYQKVEVFVNAPVTPVPLTEFQEEDVEATYRFCFSQTESMRVFYDTVPAANVVLLFALPNDTCRTLDEIFPNVRYNASLTPVVQHFAKKATTLSADKRVFVNTYEGAIDVIIFSDNRLLMLNTYEVRTLADADYYLFNMLRHLAVDPNTTPIFVSGDANLRNPLIEELQHYAPKVFPVNPAAEFNRHLVATTEQVPYDLMCALLKTRII